MRHFRNGPLWIVALLALFFAVGGSAFALGQSSGPQARCGAGAVRGVATVVGLPDKGVGNLPDTFTSNRAAFATHWSCGGSTISVRRLDTGVYQVRFDGNPAANPVVAVNSNDGAAASVTQASNHAFQVNIWAHHSPDNNLVPEDAPFTIILF